MSTTRLLVRKDRLDQTELRTQPDLALKDGQVRIAIDRFALTSNNITYAAFGDAMKYWDFYPSGDAFLGIIPVWGFGNVVQSLHPGLAVGERLYGYFPMAGSVVLEPSKLSPGGFFDATRHRADLPAVYNHYDRCASDPFYTRDTEDLQALLRPLFATSWLIDDFLADNAFFGVSAGAVPGAIVLSSASSKTAYGTAHMLAQRDGAEVVGLTSASNLEFCRGLGCYDRVLAYDQLDQLGADRPCVYVDFAGNAALREAVHRRFSNLRYSCSVGGTHVEQLGRASNLPGPRATLFFAPTQRKKRVGDWGKEQFSARLAEAWQAFLHQVADPPAPWLVVRHHHGPDAVAAAYRQVLAGHSDPRLGHILSFAQAPANP